ncbi:MAG: 50S ribosomal protein L15 [bacterium]
MNLHDLSPAPGSKKGKVRRGRGLAAHRGQTGGRGEKGQKKRSKVPAYFEGGQTPLYRRLPKRGFTSLNEKSRPQVVNVDKLNKFESGTEVTVELLRENGLIKGSGPVKLLGRGSLEVELTVCVDSASASAREKVEEAGGRVELLTGRDRG